MSKERPVQAPKLDTLSSAQLLFKDWLTFCDPTRERLWVAHLDVQRACLHFSQYDGDQFGAQFPLSEIISDVVEHKSVGILLAHNHPSGDPRPSESDCRATRALATVAEALNCRVFDHLILTGTEYTSFREIGLL